MIPEIAALETRPGVIRIPDRIDVPVTARVLRLIDTAAFQRLARISQLGLVARVYPGARHTRFEHSLGVYRNALLFARRLSQFEYFADNVGEEQLEALVVASLLHDIGHWPWCHAIEDLGLSGIPRHEAVAACVINRPEIFGLIDSDWKCDIEDVLAVVFGTAKTPIGKLLCSILSGPIDIDKMDYLYRDSLHCGVPYGMNFDAGRLINSICPNQAGDRIAISRKGKTAAEMMVFARYVMFSEVYWHHAVRSATAMIQRVFFDWMPGKHCDSPFLCELDDASMERELRLGPESDEASMLRESLFGPRRQLYKRMLEYSASENPEMYRALAHQSYDWLIDCGIRLADRLSRRLATPVSPCEILIDAPPLGLEVQFRVEVNDGGGQSCMLAEISPMVAALAEKQFDDFVKRVRVFVHQRLVGTLEPRATEAELLKILSVGSD